MRLCSGGAAVRVIRLSCLGWTAQIICGLGRQMGGNPGVIRCSLVLIKLLGHAENLQSRNLLSGEVVTKVQGDGAIRTPAINMNFYVCINTP